MSALFATFCCKSFVETPKRGDFNEKLESFGQIDDFSCFFFARNEALFAVKFVETPKRGDLVKKLRVFAKSMIFRVFSRNEALVATF